MLRCQPGCGTITQISNEILSLFAEGFEVLDKAYPVTASIGIAVYPEDAHTLAELIANADAAMYQAKSQGKNGSARYSRSLHEKRNRQRRTREFQGQQVGYWVYEYQNRIIWGATAGMLVNLNKMLE